MSTPQFNPGDPLSHFLGITGLTLYTVQRCERFLGHCLTHLLTGGTPVSIGELLTMDEAHRQAALGKLERKLRCHFNVPDSFSACLTKFIEDRNRFVHRLFHEPGFELYDASACSRTLPFIEGLFHDATFIAGTLHYAFLASYKARGKPVPDQLLNLVEPPSGAAIPLHELLKPRERTS